MNLTFTTDGKWTVLDLSMFSTSLSTIYYLLTTHEDRELRYYYELFINQRLGSLKDSYPSDGYIQNIYIDYYTEIFFQYFPEERLEYKDQLQIYSIFIASPGVIEVKVARVNNTLTRILDHVKNQKIKAGGSAISTIDDHLDDVTIVFRHDKDIGISALRDKYGENGNNILMLQNRKIACLAYFYGNGKVR